MLIDPRFKFFPRPSKTLLLARDDVGTCVNLEMTVNNIASTQLKTKSFLLDNMVYGLSHGVLTGNFRKGAVMECCP